VHMDWVIFELGGRQYQIRPGEELEVDRLPDSTKKLSLDKILMLSEKGKIELGKPYIKKNLSVEVVKNVRHKKIRVATYKAKSNERKVMGQRREVTIVKLLP